MRGLFVTGTDTGVGKTVVSAAIVSCLRERGLRIGAYKPAASGARETPDGPVWDDVRILSDALGGGFPDDLICPQRFHAPLAPVLAARAEGREIDAELLREGAECWEGQVETLVVEGAGGLLAPLSDVDFVADIARDLGFPLLIVARRSLGTINHTLLTVEAALGRGLQVAGIVLNDASPPDNSDVSRASNARAIQQRCPVPILAEFDYQTHQRLLHQSAFRTINWDELTGFGKIGPVSKSPVTVAPCRATEN